MFVTLNIYIIASVDNNTTVTNSRSLNVEYTDAEKELSLSPNSQKNISDQCKIVIYPCIDK